MALPSKNDTKSNNFFHPYRTRSHSDHDKNPPDTTNVPGSSNTIVKDEPAAGPATVIPWTLYHAIQLALSARKDWEAKKDKDSQKKLEFKESVVQGVMYYYKKHNVLPRSWTYNPATASTLVPSNKDDRPVLSYYVVPPKEPNTKGCEDDSDSDSDSDYNVFLDPSKKLPNIYWVPMKEDEIESWMQFKKLNEENRAFAKQRSELLGPKLSLNIEHPFVSVIGYFAVNGFNESFEMFVKKGECNHLRDPVFKEFTCYNFGGLCFFYMIIEANEDGIRGIYKAKVQCNPDGMRTLLKFSLIDETYDKKELFFNAFKKGFKIVEDPHIPYYSGMKRRMNAMGSTSGYDFCNCSEEFD